MLFSHKVLLWYAKNKRTLPWRRTRDPYKIWLSEIMLQQTRIIQGTPYYLRFIENFPTVHDLAAASEENILKLWQGLGYYTRARNLHATAKIISSDFDGKFPEEYNALIKLKGIGDYTASAIASICFDEPQPVLDGNVYRVLSRYFGVEMATNTAAGSKFFRQLAKEVMDSENIRDYNQGIMEFGALQCTPQNPNCSICPLREDCIAFQQNKVDMLPLKANKQKVRIRHFNYLVPVSIASDGNIMTLLRQRKGKGIWENLWEFPLVESDTEIGPKEVGEAVKNFLHLDDILKIRQFNEAVIVHKLSHQHLYTKFWLVETEDKLKQSIPLVQLKDYPVPVLIADFLDTFKNSYF
ncbi:MAG: A/G-specific adenine glycosylase [Maribacter sp.]|nr:A/G-specific adenine glycosylase [Maribacter sp.]